MTTQAILNFDAPVIEAQKVHINNSCMKVLNELLKGKLTVQDAAARYISNCLPRRIKDLERDLKISIPEVQDEKTKIKTWFLTGKMKCEIERILSL